MLVRNGLRKALALCFCRRDGAVVVLRLLPLPRTVLSVSVPVLVRVVLVVLV